MHIYTRCGSAYQRKITVKKLEVLLLVLGLCIAGTLIGCDSELITPLLIDPSMINDRTISVNGGGSVVGEPDIATLRLGVSVEMETVAEAREIAASTMTAVVETLKANDIADRDIQTERFNIYPQYDYTDNGRVLRGYRVENTVSVKVRELADLSAVIDAAALAGNDYIVVDSIQFMIEDSTALQMQARRLAVEDAAAKAQTLAEAGGVTLGDPITITETSYVAAPPIYYQESAAFSDDAAFSPTPIESGELTV